MSGEPAPRYDGDVPFPPHRRPAGRPPIADLAAGTCLWRVHSIDHSAQGFNPTVQPSVLRGGRFDSPDGSYAYAYFGDCATTAIAETICRDLPLGLAPRLVLRRDLVGRRLTEIEVTRTLPVLKLHGAGLTHVGAPLSVTKGGADQYLATRAWAVALRTWFPHIAGFCYRPRNDEDAFAWVLFDDGPGAAEPRARGALKATGTGFDLLDPAFAVDLRRSLHMFNATVDISPAK